MEGDSGSVGRDVQSQFGLGTEARRDHRRGDRKGVQKRSGRRELIEKDRRRHAETAVDPIIVKDIVGAGVGGVVTTVGRNHGAALCR